MVGVEIHNVLIGGIVLLDIVEEYTERAVEIAHTEAVCLLIQRAGQQIGARNRTCRLRHACREREPCLRCRWVLEAR